MQPNRGGPVPPEKRAQRVNTSKPCMNDLKKQPPSNHDLAFRTHSLQMILSGPIHVRTQLLLRFVSERDPTKIYDIFQVTKILGKNKCFLHEIHRISKKKNFKRFIGKNKHEGI